MDGYVTGDRISAAQPTQQNVVLTNTSLTTLPFIILPSNTSLNIILIISSDNVVEFLKMALIFTGSIPSRALYTCKMSDPMSHWRKKTNRTRMFINWTSKERNLLRMQIERRLRLTKLRSWQYFQLCWLIPLRNNLNLFKFKFQKRLQSTLKAYTHPTRKNS